MKVLDLRKRIRDKLSFKLSSAQAFKFKDSLGWIKKKRNFLSKKLWKRAGM